MARKEIGSIFDRNNRNNMNDNFEYLFNKSGRIIKQLNDLVLESGQSDTEVVHARGGKTVLNDRFVDIENELLETKKNKADRTEVNQLADDKADKGSVAQVAISKRDKDVDIEMKDLAQEVKEAMTGGSVAVVGENAVGNVNLKENAVTREKMDKNFMVNAPWLNQTTDDLDYVWNEGNYLITKDVKNNPINNNAFLVVERTKTTATNNQVTVKQTVSTAFRDAETEEYVRVIRYNEDTGEITWSNNWHKKLLDKVTRDDLDRLYNVAFPWLDKETDDLDFVWETGSYMVNSNVKNNPVENIGILEVIESKTSRNGRLSWIKQEVTLSNVNSDPIIKTRIMQVDVNTNTIEWKKDWKTLRTSGESNQSDSNSYENMKWVALGTSMTARGEYTNHVADVLDLNLDNRGVGSGGITTNASAGNTTMQAVESIEDFKGIVSIEIGPNDWLQTPLGELGDTDDTTWYGAVDKVCRTISERTSARPFIITGTTSAFSVNVDFDESQRRSVYYGSSQYGKKYIEYVNAAKEVAQHYGIPVCDVFGESGLGSYHQNNQTLSDHIHLTNLGGKIYGNHIINFLKYKFVPFPDEYSLTLKEG